MTIHLQRAIEGLNNQLLALGEIVERNVYQAVQAVQMGNDELANTVIVSDDEVDEREVQIEEECLKILALHQPVAADLRFIVSVLKINNDLERIGDLAVGISHRARTLGGASNVHPLPALGRMAERVKAMLHNSLRALVDQDATLARGVLLADDEVDADNREIQRTLQERMQAHPESIGQLMLLVGVSRSLERIADHATNIGEDVLYLTSGEIVRHGRS